MDKTVIENRWINFLGDDVEDNMCFVEKSDKLAVFFKGNDVEKNTSNNVDCSIQTPYEPSKSFSSKDKFPLLCGMLTDDSRCGGSIADLVKTCKRTCREKLANSGIALNSNNKPQSFSESDSTSGKNCTEKTVKTSLQTSNARKTLVKSPFSNKEKCGKEKTFSLSCFDEKNCSKGESSILHQAVNVKNSDTSLLRDKLTDISVSGEKRNSKKTGRYEKFPSQPPIYTSHLNSKLNVVIQKLEIPNAIKEWSIDKSRSPSVPHYKGNNDNVSTYVDSKHVDTFVEKSHIQPTTVESTFIHNRNIATNVSNKKTQRTTARKSINRIRSQNSHELTETLQQNLRNLNSSFVAKQAKTATDMEAIVEFNGAIQDQENGANMSTKNNTTTHTAFQSQLPEINFEQQFHGNANKITIKKTPKKRKRCSSSKAKKSIRKPDKSATQFSESTLNSSTSNEVSDVQISKLSIEVALPNSENKTQDLDIFMKNTNLDENSTQIEGHLVLPESDAVKIPEKGIKNQSILAAKETMKEVGKCPTILTNPSPNIPSVCNADQIKSPHDATMTQVTTDNESDNVCLLDEDDEIQVVDVRLKNNFENLCTKNISFIASKQFSSNNNDTSKEVSETEMKNSSLEVLKTIETCKHLSESVQTPPSYSIANTLQEPNIMNSTYDEVSNVVLLDDDDDDDDEIEVIDVLVKNESSSSVFMKNIPYAKKNPVAVSSQSNILKNGVDEFVSSDKKSDQELLNSSCKLTSNLNISSPPESEVNQVKPAVSNSNITVFAKSKIDDDIQTKDYNFSKKPNGNTLQTKFGTTAITPQLGVTNETLGKESEIKRIPRARKSCRGTGIYSIIQGKSTPSIRNHYDPNEKLMTQDSENRKGYKDISKHSTIVNTSSNPQNSVAFHVEFNVNINEPTCNKAIDIVKKNHISKPKNQDKKILHTLTLNTSEEHPKLNATSAINEIVINQIEPHCKKITKRNSINKHICKPKAIEVNDSKFSSEVSGTLLNTTMIQQVSNNKDATVKMPRTKKRNCIAKAKKRLKNSNASKDSVHKLSKFNIKNFELNPSISQKEEFDSDTTESGETTIRSVKSTLNVKKIDKNESINKKQNDKQCKKVPPSQPHAIPLDKKSKKATKSNTILKHGSGLENDKYEQTLSGSKLNNQNHYSPNVTVVEVTDPHSIEIDSDNVARNVPIFNNEKGVIHLNKIDNSNKSIEKIHCKQQNEIENNQKFDFNTPEKSAKNIQNISSSVFENVLRMNTTSKPTLTNIVPKNECRSKLNTTAPTQKLDIKHDHGQNRMASLISVPNVYKNNDSLISKNFMLQECTPDNREGKIARSSMNEIKSENKGLFRNDLIFDIEKKNMASNAINIVPKYGITCDENTFCHQQNMTDIALLDVPTTKESRKNISQFILKAEKGLQDNDDIDNYLYNSKLPSAQQCTSNIVTNVIQTKHVDLVDEDACEKFSNSVSTPTYANIKIDNLHVKLNENSIAKSNETPFPQNIFTKSVDQLDSVSYDLKSQNANHRKYASWQNEISFPESTCSKEFEKPLMISENQFKVSSSSVERTAKQHFSDSFSFSQFSKSVTDDKVPSISSNELVSILNNAAACIVFQTGYDPNAIQSDTASSDDFYNKSKPPRSIEHIPNDSKINRENCADLKELKLLECAKQCAIKMNSLNENETYTKNTRKHNVEVRKQISCDIEESVSSNNKLLHAEHKLSSNSAENLQYSKQLLSPKSLSSISDGSCCNETSNRTLDAAILRHAAIAIKDVGIGFSSASAIYGVPEHILRNQFSKKDDKKERVFRKSNLYTSDVEKIAKNSSKISMNINESRKEQQHSQKKEFPIDALIPLKVEHKSVPDGYRACLKCTHECKCHRHVRPSFTSTKESHPSISENEEKRKCHLSSKIDSRNSKNKSSAEQETSDIPIETSRSISRLSNSSKSGRIHKPPSRERRKLSLSREEKHKLSSSVDKSHVARNIVSGEQTSLSKTSNLESGNCSKLSDTSKSDEPSKPPLKEKETQSSSKERKYHRSSHSQSRNRTSDNITRKDRCIESDSDNSRQSLTEGKKRRRSRTSSRSRSRDRSRSQSRDRKRRSYQCSIHSNRSSKQKSPTLSHSRSRSSSLTRKIGDEKSDNSSPRPSNAKSINDSRLSDNSRDCEKSRFEFSRRRCRSSRSRSKDRKIYSSSRSWNNRYRRSRSRSKERRVDSPSQSMASNFALRSRSPSSPNRGDLPNQELFPQVSHEPYQRRVIYVNSIPDTFTTADLTHRFSCFGCVEDVNIMKRSFCKDNNFAFITYKYPEHALFALQHGNDPPWMPKFKIEFGDRRTFLQNQHYKDLDKAKEESPLLKTRNVDCSATEESDFDKSLKAALQRVGLPQVNSAP